MIESSRISFTHQEITTMIIRQQDIHEGHWSIYVEFNFGGTDMSLNGQPVLPTALVSLHSVGIQRCGAAHPLAVDAALVNPREGQMAEVEYSVGQKVRLH